MALLIPLLTLGCGQTAPSDGADVEEEAIGEEEIYGSDFIEPEELVDVTSEDQDLTPPDVVEIGFNPATVDVSGADQVVTITLRVTDDLSGFGYSHASLISPSGKQTIYLGYIPRVSGTALDGVYQTKVTLPKYSEGGTWYVSYLYLYDQAKNYRYLRGTDIKAKGLPSEFQVTSLSDTTPPNVTECDPAPKTIDVSASDQLVTLTLRLTDDLSGFSYGYGGLKSPSGKQWVYFNMYNTSDYLISGDNMDGVYQTKVTFPKYSEAGTWDVYYLYLYDKAKNYRYLNGTNLKAMGFSSAIQVTGRSDLTPPDLAAFDYTPKSIDVSNSDQIVTFTLGITDDLSGFNYSYSTLRSPSGKQRVYWYTYNSTYYLKSGNILNGIYQNKATIPRYSEAGTWVVEHFCLRDKASNNRCLNEADLKARGFIVETEVVQCGTASELCGDKIDNDCDGQTDEGFDVGNACSVGMGACQRSGAKVCSADGTGTKCSAVAGTPTTEICDGIDNDCDGQTDEGFGVGNVCVAGVGACQTVGTKVCSADKSASECSASAGTPSTEICGDGIDNDCDGSADEDASGADCLTEKEASNNTPVADAGADMLCDGVNDVAEGETILLDGLCTDANASNLLTGTWTQNMGGTGCGEINGASNAGKESVTVAADCVAPDISANENESFQLECDDGIVSVVDTVSVCINAKPSAMPQSVSTKEDTAVAVTLKGSDPNNEALTYTLIDQPAHGTLSGTPPNLTYTPLADYNGADSFAFKVSDNIQSGSSAAVSLAVGSVNDIPTACAGDDQTVTPPMTVVLDGTCSDDTDDDSLEYQWTQIAGTPVHLSDDEASQPAFKAAKSGTYTFQLVVNDGTIDSNPDFMNVTINNVKPVVDPGKDKGASSGGAVVLACKGSDENDDLLSYVWTQSSGPLISTKFPIKASDWSVTTPNVTMETTVLLNCTISDGVGGFESGTVRLTITPPASGGKDSSTADDEDMASTSSASPGTDDGEVIIEKTGGSWTITLDEGDIYLPSLFAANNWLLKISWEVVSGPDTLVIEGNRINTADYVYKRGSYQVREQSVDEEGKVQYSEPVTITMPNNPPEPPLPEEFDFGEDEERISCEAGDGKTRFTYDGYSKVISFNSIFTDVDDDQLTYRWSAADSGLEVVTAETGEVTLLNKKAGTRKVVVEVEDGYGGKTEETIEFFVPPPELTAESASLSITGRRPAGEDRETVSGQLESPVIPVVRVNGVMAKVTSVEGTSRSLGRGLRALSTGSSSSDTYLFTAEAVPVEADGGDLNIEVLTDVDGEAVSLFSKSITTETAETGGGETGTGTGHSAVAGGCSLVR